MISLPFYETPSAHLKMIEQPHSLFCNTPRLLLYLCSRVFWLCEWFRVYHISRYLRVHTALSYICVNSRVSLPAGRCRMSSILDVSWQPVQSHLLSFYNHTTLPLVDLTVFVKSTSEHLYYFWVDIRLQQPVLLVQIIWKKSRISLE